MNIFGLLYSCYNSIYAKFYFINKVTTSGAVCFTYLYKVNLSTNIYMQVVPAANAISIGLSISF